MRINHGDGILSRESSVLDLEENEVDSPENENSPSPASNEAPQAQGQNSNAQPSAQAVSPARESAQATGSEPIGSPPSEPLVETGSQRIERGTQEPSTSMSSTDANPQTAVEEAPSASSKSKSKKTSKKKKKSHSSKTKSDDTLIETAPSRFNTQATSTIAPVKPPSEEALLSKLVKELEFGTLKNSIVFLNQLVAKCPEDPDYRSLLAMAMRLRDGDVWYQYQRKVDFKEDKEPKPVVQIMKPTANESVNELKKSSWFLIRSVKR